jgi:hypothetical protein
MDTLASGACHARRAGEVKPIRGFIDALIISVRGTRAGKLAAMATSICMMASSPGEPRKLLHHDA